jgi:hypothetical protein
MQSDHWADEDKPTILSLKANYPDLAIHFLSSTLVLYLLQLFQQALQSSGMHVREHNPA